MTTDVSEPQADASTDDDGITARCPDVDCDHFFVNASDEQIGEHFNKHLPKDASPKMIAPAVIRLINFRREQHA